MPTSVLLAVLAAAGLLALAPALTRRYDVAERVAAERATSTARVLTRRRRRRTVPGRRPLNPPSYLVRRTPASSYSPSSSSSPSARASLARASSSGRPVGARSARGRSAGSGSRSPRRPRATALHRRRRVFLALVLLNLVELAGVALVGSGFWIGFSVTFVVLVADLIYLRHRAVVTARVRQRRRLRAEWIAREQAAVRREHDRRSAERVAAARRAVAERDLARRAGARRSTEYVERYRAT